MKNDVSPVFSSAGAIAELSFLPPSMPEFADSKVAAGSPSIAGAGTEFSLLAPAVEEFADPKIAATMRRLLNLCAEAGVPRITLEQSEISGQLSACAIVAGIYTKNVLLATCEALRSRFTTIILVTDAIELRECLSELDLLSQLELEGIQLALAEALGFLFSRPNRFIYAYPKPDVSCSVAVILKTSRKVILVRRAIEPFKGMYALPSGFLRPLLEDLPSCISRELFEETGLKLPERMFRLVDVRSKTDRDNRGHVIDHGFVCEVPWSLEKRLPARLVAGDDADDVQIVSLSEALRLPLAADHHELLKAAAAMTRSFTLAVVPAALRQLVHKFQAMIFCRLCPKS